MERPHRLALADGRLLDLYVTGPADGVPLVYHQGTPSAGLPYQPLVVAAAERGLRYVSWSRPGYGDSTRLPGRTVADVVSDTTAVLDHLGAETCHVLGWSGGGPHALACAALLPDRVLTVATIGCVAPYPAAGIDWMAGMGAENIEEFSAALDGSDALDRLLRTQWSHMATLTGEEVADALGDLIADVDRRALSGPIADFLAEGIREALRNGPSGWLDDDLAFARPWGFDLTLISRPVHIWQGGQDRMVPFAHGVWLAEHVRTARPHLLPAEGHLSLTVSAIGQILDDLVG